MDHNIPDFNDLSKSEQTVVDALAKCAEVMATFSPDRTVLFTAFFLDGLLDTLSGRVSVAHSIGADGAVDPRVHIAGMALAASMVEVRSAYEAMHSDDALASIATYVTESLAYVDAIIESGEDISIDELRERLIIRAQEES